MAKETTTRRNTKRLNEDVNTRGLKPKPNAEDLEEAVLGAMMLEKNAYTSVLEILKPEAFYKLENRMIYEVCKDLFEQGDPIDILTVTNELRKRGELEGVGGAYYITSLTNRVSSAANVEFHARIISEKHIQRELIRISDEIGTEASEEGADALGLLDTAQQKIFEVSEGTISKDVEKIEDVLKKAIKNLEAIKGHENTLTGVPSGFVELDRETSGWQKSDLVIIAARPGMGKTAFALTVARNAAVDFAKSIAVFSLEMSSEQLVGRLISGETEIISQKMRNGDLSDQEWERLNTKITKLADAKMFIDDTPGISVFELKAKCRRLKAQQGIDMIIIDYLQLMRGEESKGGQGNREQEIGYISRSLKGLAKELQVPVIALAQLSRAVEVRGGTKKPMLSDLRESGSIEQDADMVMFLYRPEYYQLTEFEDGMPTQGLAEIMLAKHRHGAVRDFRVRFQGEFAKFSDIDGIGVPNQGGDFSFSEDQGVQSIIMQSKMNTMDDDSDVPF
jgi:replicative DNA helicase